MGGLLGNGSSHQRPTIRHNWLVGAPSDGQRMRSTPPKRKKQVFSGGFLFFFAFTRHRRDGAEFELGSFFLCVVGKNRFRPFWETGVAIETTAAIPRRRVGGRASKLEDTPPPPPEANYPRENSREIDALGLGFENERNRSFVS